MLRARLPKKSVTAVRYINHTAATDLGGGLNYVLQVVRAKAHTDIYLQLVLIEVETN